MDAKVALYIHYFCYFDLIACTAVLGSGFVRPVGLHVGYTNFEGITALGKLG